MQAKSMSWSSYDCCTWRCCPASGCSKLQMTLFITFCLLHTTHLPPAHITAVLRGTFYTTCSSDWSDNGDAGFLGGHSPAAAQQLQVYSCQDCCGKPWGFLGTLHGVASVYHGLLCHVCVPGHILCPFGSWQWHPRDQDIPQWRAHQRCNLYTLPCHAFRPDVLRIANRVFQLPNVREWPLRSVMPASCPGGVQQP